MPPKRQRKSLAPNAVEFVRKNELNIKKRVNSGEKRAKISKVTTHSVDNCIECRFSEASIPSDLISNFYDEYCLSWQNLVNDEKNGNISTFRLAFKEHYYDSLETFPLFLQIDFSFIVGELLHQSFQTEEEMNSYVYNDISMKLIDSIHKDIVLNFFTRGEPIDNIVVSNKFYDTDEFSMFLLASKPIYSNVNSVSQLKEGFVRFVYFWPNIVVNKFEWKQFRNASVGNLLTNFPKDYVERDNNANMWQLVEDKCDWNLKVVSEANLYLPGSSELVSCSHGNKCEDPDHRNGKRVNVPGTTIVRIVDSNLNSRSEEEGDLISYFLENSTRRSCLLYRYCTINAKSKYKKATCKFAHDDHIDIQVVTDTGIYKVKAVTTKKSRGGANKNSSSSSSSSAAKTKPSVEVHGLMLQIFSVFNLKVSQSIDDVHVDNRKKILTIKGNSNFCILANNVYSCGGRCSAKYAIDFKRIPMGIHVVCGCDCGHSSHYECRDKTKLIAEPGIEILYMLFEAAGFQGWGATVLNEMNCNTNIISRYNGLIDNSWITDLFDEIKLRDAMSTVLLTN